MSRKQRSDLDDEISMFSMLMAMIVKASIERKQQQRALFLSNMNIDGDGI